MGVEGPFGPFCLVIGNSGSDVACEGVFPGDSVQRYTDETGAADATAATADATAWSDRAHLVVLHRAGEARGRPEEEWADIICRRDDYFETTVAEPLPLTTIAEVRVRTDLRGRLRTLRARSLAGEDLNGAEHNELRAYEAISRWRRAGSVQLVEVI